MHRNTFRQQQKQYELKFMKKFFYIIIASVLLLINSCKTSEKNPLNTITPIENKPDQAVMNARPPIIIYKTFQDYFYNIPVTLSTDRAKIVSYPGISDIYFNGELAYPTKLAGGYLLDNRGVGIHSAFLKITYDEYSKLTVMPSTEELYDMVIDNNPFSEMYQLTCNRDTVEINNIITMGLKKNCKKIK